MARSAIAKAAARLPLADADADADAATIRRRNSSLCTVAHRAGAAMWIS